MRVGGANEKEGCEEVVCSMGVQSVVECGERGEQMWEFRRWEL